MSFWYLATPYANYKYGHEEAFLGACCNAALLYDKGLTIYCPIMHSHPQAKFISVKNRRSHRFWLDHDYTFMTLAKGLIICKMTGWEESKGMAEEIEFFKINNKPIVEMISNAIPYTQLANYGEILK